MEFASRRCKHEAQVFDFEHQMLKKILTVAYQPWLQEDTMQGVLKIQRVHDKISRDICL